MGFELKIVRGQNLYTSVPLFYKKNDHNKFTINFYLEYYGLVKGNRYTGIYEANKKSILNNDTLNRKEIP